MNFTAAAEANLRWLLRPIETLLSDPQLTDLHINGVGEGMCFVDRGQGTERTTLPFTLVDLEDIAVNAAALTGQDIAADVPLVSTKFPDGQRVQIVRPPAVAEGQYAISVRRPKLHAATPGDLAASGTFGNASAVRQQPAGQHQLLDLYHAGQWQDFLTLAVANRLNIVFSGTVGAGKTHLMRAYTHAIAKTMRLVTIEDMPELIGLPLSNVVNMFYSKGKQSVANVTAEDLVEAALRMGMDGLLVQELRDEAAYAYLNTLESGHWGMTTTHADSAGQARDRIRGLIKKHPAGRHLNDTDLRLSLQRSIHVVVHCVHDKASGSRHIEQVLYDPGAESQHAPHPLAAE